MLIKYLSLRKDVEVHVFTPFDETTEELQRVRFHKIRTPMRTSSIERLAYSILRRMIKNRFSASNLMYSAFVLNRAIDGLASSLIVQLQKCPVDVLQAEQDIAAAAATTIRDSLGIPTVADIHDLWAEEEVLTKRICPGDKAFRTIESVSQKALVKSDLVLVGNELIKHLMQKKWSLELSRIIVIPNGGEVLNLDLTSAKKRRIVYAGNFETYEYIDLFLEAAKYILSKDPSVEISIYGSGPYENELRKLAKKSALPDSIFKGYMPREKLLPILAESSVGIVPTKKEYATPIKPFEYFSVGLPIVAIRGMWWSEVTERYHAGIASAFNAEEYASAVLRLLDADDYDQYVRGALRAVRSYYNWNKLTKSLASVYEKLLDVVP